MTKEYLPHQKSVMDEHEELCGRIKELEAYIAGDEFARLLYVGSDAQWNENSR
ncbi:hypothetical protein K1J46_18420 [Enterobacter hormaechei]|uniref:hypothetical protein n=1 Tax=Enterobacter hormaechei TaxID=158836 RepID=UPI001C6438BF|nr:hypothetical protein [Enterobacter hormaechei]MBW7765322.1 hypothetical protein [Enterobacter hormaechei]